MTNNAVLTNDNFYVYAKKHMCLVLIGSMVLLVLHGSTPWRASLVRTKYELYSFVVSLFISSILRHEEKLLCIYDSLSADCGLSEHCFPFKICPVMKIIHLTSMLFSSATPAQCCTSKQSETVKPATGFILSFGY